MISYGYMEVLYRAKFAIVNETKETLKNIHLISSQATLDSNIKKLKPSKHDGLILFKSLFKNEHLDKIDLSLNFTDSNGNDIVLPLTTIEKGTHTSAINVYITKSDTFSLKIVDITDSI